MPFLWLRPNDEMSLGLFSFVLPSGWHSAPSPVQYERSKNMITVSKEDLKKNNLPSITSSKITVEQARTLAQIIYHLLEADATEEDTNNVA